MQRPKVKVFPTSWYLPNCFTVTTLLVDRVRLCSNHIEKTINVIWWSLTGGRTGKSWTFARQLGDFWSHPPPTAPRLLRCPHLSLTWGIRPISRRKRLLGFSRRRPPPPSYHLRMLPLLLCRTSNKSAENNAQTFLRAWWEDELVGEKCFAWVGGLGENCWPENWPSLGCPLLSPACLLIIQLLKSLHTKLLTPANCHLPEPSECTL